MFVAMDGVLDDTDIDLDDDRPEESYLDGVKITWTAATVGVRNPIWMA